MAYTHDPWNASYAKKKKIESYHPMSKCPNHYAKWSLDDQGKTAWLFKIN